MRDRIQNALLCLVVLSYPFTSLASIDAYLSDREENTLGIEAEWDEDYAYISQLDCTDDIKFDLTIVLNDEDTDGREIYIFSGSNCDDSDDSSDCDDDVLKLDAEDGTVTISVSWILDDEPCSESTSTSVWVGLLENAGEKDDNATWASSISFDLDGSPPDAPTGIASSPGDEKLLVSWTYDDDDDFAGALIVYALADQQANAEADAGETDGAADAGGIDDCTGPLVEGNTVTGDLHVIEVSGDSAEQGYIRDLANGSTYQIAVAAIDENGNLSSISEVICDTPNRTVGFLEQYVNDGGKTGEYCFIATAAFGDYDHPTVRILRRFRDRFLLEFPRGEQFVRFYYGVGPTLATYVRGDTVRDVVAVLLTLFAAIAFVLSLLGPPATLLGIVFLLLLTIFATLAKERFRQKCVRIRTARPQSDERQVKSSDDPRNC